MAVMDNLDIAVLCGFIGQCVAVLCGFIGQCVLLIVRIWDYMHHLGL